MSSAAYFGNVRGGEEMFEGGGDARVCYMKEKDFFLAERNAGSGGRGL